MPCRQRRKIAGLSSVLHKTPLEIGSPGRRLVNGRSILTRARRRPRRATVTPSDLPGRSLHRGLYVGTRISERRRTTIAASCSMFEMTALMHVRTVETSWRRRCPARTCMETSPAERSLATGGVVLHKAFDRGILSLPHRTPSGDPDEGCRHVLYLLNPSFEAGG